MEKYVYFFGNGAAEGKADMKEMLGGKGANLAEMTNLGIPVPPGFTISTKVCDMFYKNDKQYPEGLREEVAETLKKLEKLMGKNLGDPKDPLLVSIRSGAAVSMPGMMDTVLNLGLNDAAVEGLAGITNNPRFAYDSYRRFIQMFSNVALGMKIDVFEEILEEMKNKKNVENDLDLDANDLKELVKLYKVAFKKSQGRDFPQDPTEQLWAAIGAVFGSWNNPTAIYYRKANDIRNVVGTAVNVQSMVFGNFGDTSGTGVCFSRDPSTGENVFYGEYLMNAQGEDVVAGLRTPMAISALSDNNPVIYKELTDIKDRLEKHYKDMQDMEFTIQEGKLFILQTRNGKRTGAAAVKCAYDMVKEGLITKDVAIERVGAEQLDQLFHPMISAKARKAVKAMCSGLNASPGAATGKVVFSAEDAEAWTERGEQVLLIRKETSPEDIAGMVVSEGILTSTGGMTSHAAVVARGMGTPCIAGCKSVVISGKTFTVNGKKFVEGDWVTIDGTTGEVFEGKLELEKPVITAHVNEFLSWCDDVRWTAEREGVEKGFYIRTNADQPEDAAVAFEFGAEGIGLCRTEHMFFAPEKLGFFQEMIVADSLEARKESLKKLLVLQKDDFYGIFKAMNGLPVTIRLLDPPLHEFLPSKEEDIVDLAGRLNITVDTLKTKIASLHEHNPMLGHRGCRLGITYPEIYDMQVEAIVRACCDLEKEGVKVQPEIMIPLVGTKEELSILRKNAKNIIEEVSRQSNVILDVKVGTMIEIPRAAITADEIAAYADFFSFGTNDLTQMTYGFSRDDIGSFLPAYRDQNILHHDPFASIDKSGVGRLVATGVELGRKVKPGMKMGVCGEHGGDPRSIKFFYETGLSYVSCSPYRVPIARLAAAQSVLANRK
ncbi:MAG: pyruvate, phosphate dikinase [Spirochaetales bacterium]|nr:pyruvate, phosphate dikinase [Spirochaetales bacterium]